MSTRVTQVSAETLLTVSNNARVTQASAEYLAAVANSARVTQVSVEFLYSVLVQAHGLSSYLKDALVNHVFRSSTFVKPTQLWIALYSIPPNADGGGTEVVGNSYARAQLNPGEINWTAPTSGNGQSSNGVDVPFPTPIGGGWGMLTAWGLFDAPSAGNLLAFSTFSAGIAVAAGSNPRFVAGDLTVTLA